LLTKQHPTCGVTVAAAMSVVAVEDVTGYTSAATTKELAEFAVVVMLARIVLVVVDGVERINKVLAHDGVWNSVRQHLDVLVRTAQEFRKQHYDQYMGAVIFSYT